MSGFYSFKIIYEHQIKSKLCWCACFSWIIKTLKIRTNHKDQIEILSFYNNEIANSKMKLEGNSDKNSPIKSNNKEINNLIKKLLKLPFSKTEIPTEILKRNKKINELFNFENVKNSLTKNKAPWIVVTENHMYLITGFGSNDCGNYILISDPNPSIGEQYFYFNTFKESFGKKIEKLWIIKNENGPSIEKDPFIYKHALKNIIPNPNIDYAFIQPFTENGAKTLMLIQKFNETVITFKNNKRNLLERALIEVFNDFLFKDFCENRIDKRDQKNIQIIKTHFRTYISNLKFNLNINDLEFQNPNDTNSFFKLISINNELFALPNDKLIEFETFSKLLNNN